MCYPCSHCGACKVRLPEGACPFCGEPLEEGVYVCPKCGGTLPLPPGASLGEISRDAHSAAPRSEE